MNGGIFGFPRLTVMLLDVINIIASMSGELVIPDGTAPKLLPKDINSVQFDTGTLNLYPVLCTEGSVKNNPTSTSVESYTHQQKIFMNECVIETFRYDLIAPCINWPDQER